MSLDLNGHMGEVATAKAGTMSIVTSTDSAATAQTAIADNGVTPVTFVVDDTEDDGKTRSDSYEHEFSSRAQLAALVAREKAEEAAELADLTPLNDEAAKGQEQMLAELQQQGEQEAEGEEGEQEPTAGDLTPEEMAQVRQQAVADAIATGRAQVNFNPQVLAAQYDQAQQAVIADYTKKLEQTKARHSDFDAVMAELAQNDVPLSQAKTEALLTVGGPELVYRLAKAPSKARELAGLPDHVAVAKIGQMAAELNARPQPTRQRANLAPTKAVGGNIRNAPSIADPDISFVDFKRAREKQIKNRYK